MHLLLLRQLLIENRLPLFYSQILRSIVRSIELVLYFDDLCLIFKLQFRGQPEALLSQAVSESVSLISALLEVEDEKAELLRLLAPSLKLLNDNIMGDIFVEDLDL